MTKNWNRYICMGKNGVGCGGGGGGGEGRERKRGGGLGGGGGELHDIRTTDKESPSMDVALMTLMYILYACKKKSKRVLKRVLTNCAPRII